MYYLTNKKFKSITTVPLSSVFALDSRKSGVVEFFGKNNPKECIGRVKMYITGSSYTHEKTWYIDTIETTSGHFVRLLRDLVELLTVTLFIPILTIIAISCEYKDRIAINYRSVVNVYERLGFKRLPNFSFIYYPKQLSPIKILQ